MESRKANINKTSLRSARQKPVDNASNAKLVEIPLQKLWAYVQNKGK
jgi:hypothetical protein